MRRGWEGERTKPNLECSVGFGFRGFFVFFFNETFQVFHIK